MKFTASMVRRQVHLARRSLSEVARRPSVARELPRLIATGGRSTMRLGVPWLPFRVVDELTSIVDETTRVFEYGGGGSTLWFLRHGATVVTVEHHSEWVDLLEASIESPRWTLLRRDARDGFRDYVGAIREFPVDDFDVVVVDGRERARCVEAALDRVRPGGMLIVDDVDRTRYDEALRKISWPRRDVVGFAPAKPTLAYTAVFVRPVKSS